MKKFRLRDYLPVLIMVLCAAIFGVLLAAGVMDLDTVPQLVADRPVLAVLVVLGLYVLKGFSGVVVYNALVVMVSMVLPLPAALAVNGVGTAACLSISYAMGRFTKTESLESVLDRHPKIKRYFSATQEYGFAMCFAIHMLGLNMEVLGLLLGMLRVDYLTYLAGSWLGHCAGDGLSGHRRKFAGSQFAGVLGLPGHQHGTGGVQRGVHPAKAPGRQGQRREAGRVEDDRLRAELLLSWMPEQVDYLHAPTGGRCCCRGCRSRWTICTMPPTGGRCWGGVREFRSGRWRAMRSSGPTGCGRTTNTPSATARPWRPEVFELHRHGAAEEVKDSKAPEANGFGGLAVWGEDGVGGQMT